MTTWSNCKQLCHWHSCTVSTPLPWARQRPHRRSWPHSSPLTLTISVPSAVRPLHIVLASVNNTEESSDNRSLQLYGQIERVFTDVAKRSQGGFGDGGDWQEIEGTWVIRPKSGTPSAVVHFIGGVFVGAAPQLTYRLFLELLAERGFLIIATPFASGFDHFRIADEVQFKFDRCMRAIRDDFIENLPVFGVGHSMGALMQLLIGARYAVQRAGNVLMCFNNKEASRAIPLFSPVIVPMAQNLGPFISQLMASPTTEMALKNLQTLSPPFLKQILPLVEQLPPLYMDLANGKDNFVPSPDETRKLIKSYYGVQKNLLIKFQTDDIDETSILAQTLSSESAVSSSLDMSIRTLKGDHARPLQQVVPVVPSAMADAVSRGSEILANLAAGTPWASVARDVGQSFNSDMSSQGLRQQIIDDIEELVDEVATWIEAAMSKMRN
ncbi:hypothetical protein KP509_28G013200 [Ceratopteris richardii]|uniref:Uncharacterized protein n=1 Tax=Ceratopteris richardii TaxID=49495 RepID=A0A8T2RAV7_CERRI|nr:hypothetical protein KP509_28G013200 [Ceratopteris richardii]